ncbi:MAG: hypothetical protein VX527_08885, partial [Planctomycetota bacterium]|nr:hypothetical protein [Planctomycetota bacterium]
MVLRADLEKVNGEYQGAIWPFRTKVGSVCRVRFGQDGTLYAGLTNRGWGGMEPAHGLRRIRWTGQVPLEMSSVDVLPDGFEIKFTKPLADEVSPEEISAWSYRYNWWWEYGSPEQDRQPLQVSATHLSEDRRTLQVSLPGLQAGQCVRMALPKVKSLDGHALLHPEFSYTVNQLPGDTKPAPMIARRVAPPLQRGAGGEAGWLRLTWGAPLDRVQGRGWRLGAAELDDQGDFEVATGHDLLINDPSSSGDLQLPVGDMDGRLRLSVFLPRGGGVGIGLASGARVVLRDHGTNPPAATIQVLDADDAVLVDDEIQYWFGAGQWQTLEIDQQAPKHDASGRQLDRGRISIYLENVAVVDAIELPMTSGDESADGRLRILGHIGPAGVADIRFHPTAHALPSGGVNLLSNAAVEKARKEGDIQTQQQDGRLFLSESGDFKWSFILPGSYVVAARMRFTEQTSAELDLGDALRVHLGQDEPGDPATGSLAGIDEVTTQLIPDGAWFDFLLQVENHQGVRHVSVSINGVQISSGDIPVPGEIRLGMLSPAIKLDAGSLELSSFRIIPRE